MNVRKHLRIALLCVVASACATASADEIAWDGKSHAVRIADGRVTSLLDKSRQTELIVLQIEDVRGMFRVTLNRGLKKAFEVESSAMWLSESEAKGGVLRMTFQSKQLRAVVSLRGGRAREVVWVRA